MESGGDAPAAEAPVAPVPAEAVVKESVAADPAPAAEVKKDGDSKLSDLEEKIVRQVEYYFSDYNLPRDKFLREEIKKDEGWVSMETMLKFNRLASISNQAKVITDALKKASSQFMEVSGDGSKIRRSEAKPLPEDPEEFRREVADRTVYCKGFPADVTTMAELLEFFSKYGSTDDVRMRKYLDKTKEEEKSYMFTGSAFVTFKDRAQAEAFMAMDSVEFKGKPLTEKIWVKDWLARKLEKKEKRKEDKKGKEQKKDDRKPFPKGAVLKLTGIPSDGEIQKQDICNALKQINEEIGGQAFYLFQKGDVECFVRCKVEDGAKRLMSGLKEKQLEVKDKKLDVQVLEGKEEEDFLVEQMKQMLDQKGRKRARDGGGRGRGGKRGRRSGRGGRRGGARGGRGGGDGGGSDNDGSGSD